MSSYTDLIHTLPTVRVQFSFRHVTTPRGMLLLPPSNIESPLCYVSQFHRGMDPFLPPLLDPLGISHVHLHVAAISSSTSVLHLVLRSLSFYTSCLLYGFTLHRLRYFPIGFNTCGFHCFVPLSTHFWNISPLI